MPNITLGERIRNAWNAFTSRSPTSWKPEGYGYAYRPDRIRLTRGNERSIITSVLNKIAIDVASIDIKHVELDKDGRYLKDKDSGLNNILTLEANIDQSGREFVQDVVMSMFDEGCVAMVPIDTDEYDGDDPSLNGAFDILTMRVAKILQWYPQHIRVRVYNDRTGRQEDIELPKRRVAIVENPLYAVMNEPNSTFQRLVRKLNYLDAIDDRNNSGKLDLIIQMPYGSQSSNRRKYSAGRREEIENQLVGSKYGIAYLDATERIIQLNRPVDNNLLSQVEFLTSMLYSQLGITEEILKGTADEQTMLNYFSRSVEPVLSAIAGSMKRKFLTKTARTKGQSIMYFRDPFRLVPLDRIAEMADKFTRNEIMTSNEIRQKIGMKPSDDPKADQLINSNLNQQEPIEPPPELVPEDSGDLADDYV